MQTSHKNILIYSLSILLSLGIGWYIHGFFFPTTDYLPKEFRENNPEYKYINPLLLVSFKEEDPHYLDIKHTITDYIANETSNGDVTVASAYFRDINSGSWTGVNQDALYEPSSMLKVAVMMGYLDAAYTDPSILTKKLMYTAKVDPGQHYLPAHPLTTGSYTAWELIQSMIIDSDNNALDALYANDPNSLVSVLKTLQIPPPSATSTSADFMSPALYSRLLRSLYNGSYLSPEISEKALELLSLTDFKKGIVAGVPAGTVVAHKFGEHTSMNPLTNVAESRQLHDCGIVYYPAHPYLICIMTKGHDFDKLQTVISTISKMVYDKVKAGRY